jgi:hypothetical protein
VGGATPAAGCLALVLLLAAGAVRASEAEVTTLMEDYWRAYARSDFVAAAEFLDPRDLAALKEGLLPLFLEAAESKNVNVQPLAKAFFTGTPARKREGMTEAQVFAGTNYMMRVVVPHVYEQLHLSSIRVVKVTLPGDGTAAVEYVVRLPDAEVNDVDRANLHEGRWYLRTKDTPAETIERYRKFLGLDYEMGPEVKLSPTDDAGARE